MQLRSASNGGLAQNAANITDKAAHKAPESQRGCSYECAGHAGLYSDFCIAFGPETEPLDLKQQAGSINSDGLRGWQSTEASLG